MRLLILAALLAAPGSAAEAPFKPAPFANMPVPPRADCKRPDLRMADTPLKPELKRLGELPPGDLVLGVYNEVEGCMDPVIVRYGSDMGPLRLAPQPVRPQTRLFR